MRDTKRMTHKCRAALPVCKKEACKGFFLADKNGLAKDFWAIARQQEILRRSVSRHTGLSKILDVNDASAQKDKQERGIL